MPILLTENDVKSLLSMEALIQAMEGALAEFSARTVQQPLRSVLKVDTQPSFFGVMPALMPSIPALGTKLVTLFPANTERGLPTHLATIVLFSPETGALVGILDGRYITEARTAAVSAVSVKHLARDDAHVVAVIGSGVQARSHLEAIGVVRSIDDVRLWSRSRARCDAFVREMQPSTPGRIRVAGNAQDAVDGADIVVLVTASHEPVVFSDWIADGTHICAVGACRPDQREMEAKLVARARLYVDSREGALAEAGDVVLAIRDKAIDPSHIAAELGEVVANKDGRRRNRQEVTIFKSLGMAVEDVAAAHLAVQEARMRGLGASFSIY
jgi:ornithine cyclodeaminase/alanine dehydrogenase-like protein (mu-crystallin family)